MDDYRKGLTAHDIEMKIPKALQAMTRGGFYGPLMERFPLITKNLPPSVESHLRAKGSPACADGNNVFVQTEIMAHMLNEMFADPKLRNDMTYPETEIMNILIHEYTHILCQHTRQGKKFMKNKDEHKIKTFMTACEIEANRGYRIRKYSATYEAAVTEEKFPETMGVEFLPDIYQVLLSNYGDQIENCKGKNEKNEENEENEDGEESKDEETPKDENDSSSKNRGGDEDGGGDDGEGKKPLTEKQKEVIENMLDSDGDLSEEVFNEPDYGDGEGKSLVEEIMDELGMGNQIDDDMPEEYASPKKKLQYIADKARAMQVAKELAKLKGVIAGSISRERIATYSRQSRRQSDDGLILKGKKRSPRSSPRILVAMDASGSMDGTTSREVASAIAGIFETCGRPTEGCYICMHRSSVSNLKPLRDWESVAEQFYADGGNNFRRVVETALKLNVDVVLNIGDGLDSIFSHFDSDMNEEIGRRGLQWYDCLVGNSDISSWSIEAKADYHHFKNDSKVKHMTVRHLIDLTGKYSEEERRLYAVKED